MEHDARARIDPLQVADQVTLIHASDGKIIRDFVIRHWSVLGDKYLLAHGAVTPVREFGHPGHELLIHGDLEVAPRGAAVHERNAQQFKEPVGTVILVGNVEQLPAVIRNMDIVSAGTPIRQVIAGGHAGHFRKSFQLLHHPGMVLIVSAEDIEIVQILVVVARIAVGHLLILPADDEHHHHQEYIDQHLDS